MPDISMCQSEDCPVRKKCGRNAASGTRPSDWQAYSEFAWTPAFGKCDYYWPTTQIEDQEGV